MAIFTLCTEMSLSRHLDLEDLNGNRVALSFVGLSLTANIFFVLANYFHALEFIHLPFAIGFFVSMLAFMADFTYFSWSSASGFRLLTSVLLALYCAGSIAGIVLFLVFEKVDFNLFYWIRDGIYIPDASNSCQCKKEELIVNETRPSRADDIQKVLRASTLDSILKEIRKLSSAEFNKIRQDITNYIQFANAVTDYPDVLPSFLEGWRTHVTAAAIKDFKVAAQINGDSVQVKLYGEDCQPVESNNFSQNGELFPGFFTDYAYQNFFEWVSATGMFQFVVCLSGFLWVSSLSKVDGL